MCSNPPPTGIHSLGVCCVTVGRWMELASELRVAECCLVGWTRSAQNGGPDASHGSTCPDAAAVHAARGRVWARRHDAPNLPGPTRWPALSDRRNGNAGLGEKEPFRSYWGRCGRSQSTPRGPNWLSPIPRKPHYRVRYCFLLLLRDGQGRRGGEGRSSRPNPNPGPSRLLLPICPFLSRSSRRIKHVRPRQARTSQLSDPEIRHHVSARAQPATALKPISLSPKRRPAGETARARELTSPAAPKAKSYRSSHPSHAGRRHVVSASRARPPAQQHKHMHAAFRCQICRRLATYLGEGRW